MASAFPEVVPVLSDGVVTLRAHHEADVPGIVEQCTDPASVAFTTVPRPYGHTHAHEFIGTQVPGGWADGTFRAWAVEAKDDDGVPRFAGSVDYRPGEVGTAEIGFGLHPWARGRRVMTRAVRLLLQHAFDHGIDVMHWSAFAGNWPSRRVAWACGFRIEGTVRELLTSPAGRHDAWVGSLRKGEPMEPQTRWLEAPVLEAEDIRLRPWREDDRPTEEPDEPARRFIGPVLPPSDADGHHAWLLRRQERMATGDAVLWCIADRTDDRALGSIVVFGLDNDFTRGSGEIGYWLHPSARGRGATDRAVRLLMAHAFTPAADGGLGLHRLHAGADVDNIASQRVLRRAGMRLIGVEQRCCAHEDGPPTDGPLFEVLAEEYADQLTSGAPWQPRTAGERAAYLGAVALEGERIRLRPFTDADAPRVAELMRHEDFGPWHRALAGVEDGRAWIASRARHRVAGEALAWAIAEVDGDRPVGVVRLFRLGDGFSRDGAEVGYWLDPAARGHGCGHDALELLLEHAFTAPDEGGLGLRRVRATTSPENLASQTILRRAGFMRWAVEPQAVAPGSFGMQRTASQGPRPSSSRLHYAVSRDDDRVAAAALAQKQVREAVRVGGRTRDGQVVRLRPWADGDVERIVQACTDATSRHWLAGLPAGYDVSHAQGYVTESRARTLAGEGVFWCVADAQDRCVGSIALMGLAEGDAGTGEVGYWTHPDARGHGVMSEATRLAVRHAFLPGDEGGLGLRRLRLNVADGNEGSAAIARRNGFVAVGRDRRAEPLGDGTFVDLVRFDQLAEEWAPGSC
ncbi:MAG TPA: GNAT family N-acetyltransferase [Segeticoccus sp.]|nr:GNAT family N-acetyltransferase [Segeticoccus sp.]